MLSCSSRRGIIQSNSKGCFDCVLTSFSSQPTKVLTRITRQSDTTTRTTYSNTNFSIS
ncbi:hypothetical protein BJX66DRAFT_293969 [Aspergillus keveii]|uniref:Uncharacterized protein n=1 Tax=Aspergillus keveii TaxID=714993 RepID=A0ABR4GJH6_9EURO